MPLGGLLDEVNKETEQAKDTVGGGQGPLPPAERATVEAHLDNAEQAANDALDDLGHPGQVDQTLPATLPDIAQKCHLLADAAYRNHNSPNMDPHLIGSNLQTILWLFDATNGYREKAGIT